MKMRDNPNMESFYEENAAQLSGQAPTIVTTASGLGHHHHHPHNNNNNSSSNSNHRHHHHHLNGVKRPLTLDLNGKDLMPGPKRLRFNNSVNTPSVISSPDLQMLKMASPELEKFIMNNNNLQTPTPGLIFPQKVTSEQADYVKGFEDALFSLHRNEGPGTGGGGGGGAVAAVPQLTVSVNAPASNNNTSNNNNSSSSSNSNSVTTVTTTISTNSLSMSGGTVTYTNLDDSLPVIKDEPQTVPNSPSLSPIDMENQEKIKLERKRHRNRIAASKCRKRKLERISKLEDRVKLLKGENSELGSVVMNLKQHVIQLKQQIIEHVNAGCRIPIQQF